MNTGTKRGPSLRRHKRSGNGYAKFNGQQVWFGPFDDPATHARFAAFKAEWEANGRSMPTEPEATSMAITDLVARYLEHAEVYYRKPDGTPTDEVLNIRHAARPLLRLFGRLAVADFNLRGLKRLRESMIDSGLARPTVNARISRVVRIFAWGAEDELVPPVTYGSLRALKPLKRGRSRARETTPITPVPWASVEAVLPHVSRPIAAMILIQWYSGARPGEVVQLRPAGLDRGGPVWTFRPRRHKTEHLGRERVISLGPKAQEVLRPFLFRVPPPAPEQPLFSPRDALAERHARDRAQRRTPLWRYHVRAQARKRSHRPKNPAGEEYSVASYGKAIRRGCQAAGVPAWTPNQLRHAAATRIRKECGLDAARAVLGHTSTDVTEVYAQLDQRKSQQVMAELG